MIRYTVGVLILLPQSLLGLILLASRGSVLGPANNTSTLHIEDLLDDQPFQMPFSNLDRVVFPSEWDDITLNKDTLRQRRKRHRRQHRPLQVNGVLNKNKDSGKGEIYSNAPQAENMLRHKRSEMRGDEAYVIRSSDPVFMRNRQDMHHTGSLNANMDVVKKSKLVALLSSPSSHRSDRSSRHHLHRYLNSSLAPSSSFGSSSWKSYSKFEDSNIRHNGFHIQREGLSSSGFRNYLSSFSVNRTDYVPLEKAISRTKRHVPIVTRIKLSQLVGMTSEIGQPIIVRKRNRIEAKVGVLVVVENSIYRQYLMDNGNNPKAALARMRRYYGMIFSMMDQRFKTINDPYFSVSVSISGILVAESREESSWLELIVDWTTVRSHGRGSVITDRALKKFTKWVSGQSNLPEHDHAMVFTAYRLTNKQGVSLGGMAYLNAICDTSSGNAVSIVADVGDFQCVKVATHELAHSLGAYHDGDRQSKTCRPDSNYIMSPLTSHENHVLRNAFYFSPCSIRDMSYHLSKTSSMCVKDDPSVYYSYDLNRLPPGQLYSADMQCKLIFGNKSEFCREGNLPNIMCGQLWCRDPNKDNGCRTNTYLTALPGTECRPNMVCHLGECVMDNSRNTIHRPTFTSSINVISRVIPPKKPSFRTQGSKKQDSKRLKHRAHTGKRARRKRRNRCNEDKNPQYCQGLIRLNPGGCQRRAIRQYCCFTCRQQQRQRPRRLPFDDRQ